MIPEKNKKEKNITKPKPPEPKILGNKLIKNKENTKISTAKTDIVIKKPEQNQEKYKEKLIKPPILPVLSAQPLVQKSPKVEKPLETPVNEKKKIKTELTKEQKQEEIIEIPPKQQQIKEESEEKTNNQEIQTPIDQNQKQVDTILKGIQEDLKILANPPINNESSQTKASYNAAKNRIYNYKFTDKKQFDLFKKSFPKTPLTEQQAKYIFDFWENNYAQFNPSMARMQSARNMWRAEIKKVLNIIPKPQVGAFNRASGGQTFIIDLRNKNDSGWVQAQK